MLDLVLFEPWFLLEVLRALAGWQYARTARGRLRWVAGISGGTLVLLLFGRNFMLALTGKRVAVG